MFNLIIGALIAGLIIFSVISLIAFISAMIDIYKDETKDDSDIYLSQREKGE